MNKAKQYVCGDLSLEELLLCSSPARGGRTHIALAVGRDSTMAGVQDEGNAPVFTPLDAGLGAGFGACAEDIFQALDAIHAWEGRSAWQGPLPAKPSLPLEVRPALVSALAELVKEGGHHVNR